MGFRPNRTTIDNIFIVRQIYEKCHEYNIDLHNIFKDFSQAFDTINRDVIYRVRINYRRILQNHIFTSTEQKYMMLLPFERGMFAVS